MRSADRATEVDGDVAAAMARVRSAVDAVGARVTEVDPAGRVQARTGASWRSWGERVSVQLEAHGGSTRVRVHVQTSVRLTLVDYGATRILADRILRAVAEPRWAAELLADTGPSALVRLSIWLGVVAAGFAAWAAVPSAPQERTVLLVAAVVAAGLWSAGVLLGALRVRRRRDTVPGWQLAFQMAAFFIIGFPTADALQPRHASVAENFSATLSAAIGATAAAALIVTAVRRVRGRVRASEHA